jgi:hypothetical protein
MNGEKCALDAKASPQQRRSEDNDAVQYSCKLEGRMISLDIVAIQKQHMEFIVPNLSMEKSSYVLQARIMEGERCQFVALEKTSRLVVNFEGALEHRSRIDNSGGGLKRNISCKVFSSERTARKAYKGRAELKFKHEPQSNGNPDEELGD